MPGGGGAGREPYVLVNSHSKPMRQPLLLISFFRTGKIKLREAKKLPRSLRMGGHLSSGQEGAMTGNRMDPCNSHSTFLAREGIDTQQQY